MQRAGTQPAATRHTKDRHTQVHTTEFRLDCSCLQQVPAVLWQVALLLLLLLLQPALLLLQYALLLLLSSAHLAGHMTKETATSPTLAAERAVLLLSAATSTCQAEHNAQQATRADSQLCSTQHTDRHVQLCRCCRSSNKVKGTAWQEPCRHKPVLPVPILFQKIVC